MRRKDCVWMDVAESRKFLPGFIVERLTGSANQDIGCNSKSHQFFDCVLCWFGLLFANRSHNWDKRYVNKRNMFSTDTELELAKCFKIRCAFDIANSATKFNDANVRRFFTTVSRPVSDINDPILYCIGDVWNDLNGLAEIVATSFCFEDLGEDFSSRKVVISSKIKIEETFVIAKVQVDFATVIKDENFSVLEWTHCSSIAVEIRVNFDGSDSQPSTLEENADATCSNTFAQSTEHSPADNYVLQTHQRDFKPSRIPYQYWL